MLDFFIFVKKIFFDEKNYSIGAVGFSCFGIFSDRRRGTKGKTDRRGGFSEKSQIHRPYQCADFLGGGKGSGYGFGGGGNPAENPAFGKFKCRAEFSIYGARWEF